MNDIEQANLRISQLESKLYEANGACDRLSAQLHRVAGVLHEITQFADLHPIERTVEAAGKALAELHAQLDENKAGVSP